MLVMGVSVYIQDSNRFTVAQQIEKVYLLIFFAGYGGGGVTLRFYVNFILLCLAFHSTEILADGTTQLFVYAPSLATPFSLQRLMHPLCDEAVKILVFGKYRDFYSTTKTRQPDLIVSLEQVLKRTPGYTLTHKGMRAGRSTEPYTLVLPNNATFASLEGKYIGAVNYLGRSGMTKYMQTLFGDKYRFTFTGKMEDLSGLLRFGQAQAIFLSVFFFERSRAFMPKGITTVNPNIRLPLPQVATRANTNAEVATRCIENWTPEVNRFMGVESWERI